MSEKLEESQLPLASPTGNSEEDQSEYVDLAPIDKADQSGIYSEALFDAVENPNVFNIALTGPYGSGKSSIIRTFLKNYDNYRFSENTVLQISLAAFLPESRPGKENDTKREKTHQSESVSKQEIERSILQQMLYGADANSLPLSRFKRIQSPRKLWSQIIALLIVFGVVSCWYLLQNQEVIFDRSFYQSHDQINWFNIICAALGAGFVWQILYQLYIKSFGISLKSISLKDIEIEPEAAREDSILNRHLDEIIYFFQCTNYELVVIEDLDRFNNPDIFVTLREINSLINANAGVDRQIRFLYALRDNMFDDTDRTKFFEFIIPVIPIINSSNSIDKMIEQEKRLCLPKRLDSQFLKEVSRYLNDLRLIQNIFNEYTIYRKNLGTVEENSLDPHKLLAVLIYKNVLPSDFEELHRDRGNFAKILSQREHFITKQEASFKSDISVLEKEIKASENQFANNLDELRKIYVATLIAQMPEGYSYVQLNGSWFKASASLWKQEDFDQIFENKEIICRHQQGPQTTVNSDDLQYQIDTNKTFKQRKEEVERKSEAIREKYQKKLQALKADLSTVRMKKFNELIRADTDEAEKLFEPFYDSRELIKFLVFEGFLDDTYYQYTSLFHSGRLSPSDNKFLIQIRAFNNPDPDFPIDNPKAVIDAMREDDFGQHFILNVILVDCMLSNPTKYSRKINRLLEFISSKFEECNSFFPIYYQRGKHVSELISRLFDKWPGFISAALESADSVMHVARLVAFLPEKHLKSLHQQDNLISEFISTNLSEVLGQEVDFDPARLTLISIEVQDLEALQSYPAIARLLTDEGLYNLSPKNIEFIFRDVFALPSVEKLDQKNYSTISNSGCEALISKIEGDFKRYLHRVLLQLENNTEEDVSAIISVLSHSEIDSEDLLDFLDMQSAKVPSLHDVPTSLHKALFEKKKIEATWVNCLAFLNNESSFDREVLTAFLQDEDIKAALSASTISGDGSTLPLREFLINNNELNEDIYRAYVRALPAPIDLFPDGVASEKCLILIEEEKVSFSKAALDQLGGYPEYQREFIEQNIDAYMRIMDQLSIDDDLREQLLSTDISDEHKLRIVGQMDLAQIEHLPARASIIGQLYYRSGADVDSLDGHVVQVLVMHIKPTENQIAFLNRCHKSLSKDQVKDTLQKLPTPYSNIRPGRRPMIRKTKAHMELVEWLKKRKIISSVSDSFSGESIYVNNYRTER